MLVALIVDTVTAEPPSEAVAPGWNPVPVIVIEVPPAVDPLFGVTPPTVGAGATYVKQPPQVPLWASTFVTITFTAPAAFAVVVPVIAVALIVETVSAEQPKETVAPATKPVPATVTEVPPAVGPLVGVTELTTGAGARYVKQPVQVPLCVSALVTMTFTAPAACAVVVPVIAVALMVDTFKADPPKETAAPAAKPVPVTLTDVPPALPPLLGVTEATVGAGATYVKQPVQMPLCVSGLVTATLTAPAACAVVVPVMLAALIVETVSAEPPNETVAPLWKSLPAIVTDVPPAVTPLLGVTELTIGAGATYVKQPVQVPLCVSGLVTTTFTAPAACAVVVPVMLVALTVETASAEPPNETVAPLWKSLPAIVTDVPPAVTPLLGVTELTIGAGARYVKQPVQVPLCASGLVTTTFTAPAA